MKQGVIYHIFIDRFAGFHNTKNWDQPIFLGGTIKGIIDKLPYLLDLGVTTLWISPFYKTSAYHGYHITDFYQVDPHFGTLEDIKELIQRIPQITTFTSSRISSRTTAQKNTRSSKKHNTTKTASTKTGSTFTDWPDQYLCFLSVRDIPKLNLNNPPTRDHIVNAAKYWLSLGSRRLPPRPCHRTIT